MADRPYTLLSCCVSLDGYLDSAVGRLALSNAEDFDRVDAVRASCDAILVGANTIRRDDPALLVKSANRHAERLALGRTVSPIRVTITVSGELDPAARFFRTGDGDRLVYCPSPLVRTLQQRLGVSAVVVDAGEQIELPRVSEDLSDRGVDRLMVEGGGRTNTQFLSAGLVDELHLAVAPFFVGDTRARRFVEPGDFPWGSERRARLVSAGPVGDVALLRYALSDRGDAT